MSNESIKYRLVTRSDFDGLVCAILLKELELIDEIKFVHPKDVQDNKINITSGDITTNLPYVKSAHLAFDHHKSEKTRIPEEANNHIIDALSPSAARVLYNHYGGVKKFPNISADMMWAVDKADSANFSQADILRPQGWVLLSFIMDPRTGLGRFQEFRISNYDLMMHLINYCRNHTIDEILELPDIKDRVNLYHQHENKFKVQLQSCSRVYKNVLVVNLKDESTILAGNRFIKYTLFPRCNISIQILWGVKKHNTVFAVGKSIFNTTSKVDVGAIMLEYGGGGHENAGTCQIENDKAADILLEIIAKLQK